MQALAQLGVSSNTLSQQERVFLAENGYLNLGKLLSDEQLESVRATIDRLLKLEGESAGAELMDSPYIKHPKEAGADRLADLVNKDPIFDQFYTHPRVLAAVEAVVGAELKLSSLNYRAAKAGDGLQKLHVDWHETVQAGDFKVCNSIWLLDDFSAENGATRMVPKTHLSGILPQDAMADPFASHPDEIILDAPAGTVVIFNSHTWHGGTTNRTQKHRRAVHSYFCRRDQPQQIDQSRYLTAATKARLSESALEVLAV